MSGLPSGARAARDLGQGAWWPAGGRLLWTGGGLVPYVHEAGEPLVIDSWLVAGGRTRGLELHHQRFRDACARLLPGLGAEALDGFLDAARAAVPPDGRWFPRVEGYAAASSKLMLWGRPAPEPRTHTVLWVADTPDPRRRPRVKGPDLPALAALRAAAEARGADDALLRTADGTVLEAAHAAVVWWEEDDLCVPADDLPVLPSVTRTLLAGLARERGVRVRQRRRKLRDLDGLEVWTLSALHGIRAVSAFLGVAGVAPAPAVRAAEWRGALASLQDPDTS